jgi:hypothetical protein
MVEGIPSEHGGAEMRTPYCNEPLWPGRKVWRPFWVFGVVAYWAHADEAHRIILEDGQWALYYDDDLIRMFARADQAMEWLDQHVAEGAME